MMNFRSLCQSVNPWVRFMAGGAANTFFTYLVYLGLNEVVRYQIAFFIAYASGIVFSYWFNSIFVFGARLSWRGLMAYPSVYLIQYFFSSILLDRLVEFFLVSETLAPLMVTVLMIPITYLLSKAVLYLANMRE